MTKGTKPKEYYQDQNGQHPVFALADIVSAGEVAAEIGDDEIKDNHIDWGTGAGQVSAGDIPSADAGNRYTAEDTDGQLQEIAGTGRTTETVKGNADTIATKVPTSRQIIAGTGLSGGGDLSADRTLSVSPDLLYVREEQSSGTNGGASTSGAWYKRVLNTVKKNDIDGASLASDEVTLPAGNYFVIGRAPFHLSGAVKIKLYNVSDTSDILIGSNLVSHASYGDAESWIFGTFSLAAQKNVAVYYRCGAGKATDGLGVACAFSVVEVYTELLIWKVA